MKPWPFSEKKIRAVALIPCERIPDLSVIIYEGYDFNLLADACRQSCVYGVKRKNEWWPPNKISRIEFGVDDYAGTFEESEQEVLNWTEKT